MFTNLTPQRRNRSGTTLDREYLDTISKSDFWTLFWIPDPYIHRIDGGKYREYLLNFYQKVFLVFEFPVSCVIASCIALFHMLVIALNVSSVIVSSIPSNQFSPSTCSHPACDNNPNLCPGHIICAPIVKPIFAQIDIVCVIIFTIEFVIRICLCSFMPTRLSGTVPHHWDDTEKEKATLENRIPVEEPVRPPYEIFLRYFFSLGTFIDLASIIPNYIVIVSGAKGSKSLTYLRVFRMIRLLRIMRLNKQGRMILELLTRTLYRSREAIGILLFYLALIVLFFAAAIYAVEEGKYTINEEYPDGEYLRPNGYGGQNISNFNSISTTIYYVIVTISTVGYGDMVPTTLLGRAFASIVCLLGIIATAMPISIISSNFNIEYKLYVERKRQFDKVMRIRDKRGSQLVHKNLQGASSALNARLAAIDIMSRYRSSRSSFHRMVSANNFMSSPRNSKLVSFNKSSRDEASMLQMDHIYEQPPEQVEFKDSLSPAKMLGAFPGDGVEKAVTFNIESRKPTLLEQPVLPSLSADDRHVHMSSSPTVDTKESTMYDHIMHVDDLHPMNGNISPLLFGSTVDDVDEASDYIVPHHVKSMAHMSNGMLDKLDEEELRVLFRELRISYHKLFQKIRCMKDMMSTVDELAAKIASKEI